MSSIEPAESVGDIARADDPGTAEAAPKRTRRFDAGNLIDIFFVPALLLVLCLYVSQQSPYFATVQNFRSLLLQFSVLGLLALGATFVIIAGELDLSAAANAALAGLVATVGMTRWSDSIWIGILLGVVAALAFGAVNGFLVTVARVPSFVATLGTMVIGGGIALVLTNASSVTGLPDGFEAISNTMIAGFRLIVFWLIGFYIVAYLILHRTTFGLRLFAIGGNREAARLSGVNVAWLRFLVFVVAGFIAGAAGILNDARLNSGQTSMPSTFTLYAVAAVVLGGTSLQGGRGGVLRTFLGVALIATLQNGLDLLGYSFAEQQIAVGVVFILAASSEVIRRRL